MKIFMKKYYDSSTMFPLPDDIVFIGDMSDDSDMGVAIERGLEYLHDSGFCDDDEICEVLNDHNKAHIFVAIDSDGEDDDKYYMFEVVVVPDDDAEALAEGVSYRPFIPIGEKVTTDYDYNKYLINHIDTFHPDQIPSYMLIPWYMLIRTTHKSYQNGMITQMVELLRFGSFNEVRRAAKDNMAFTLKINGGVKPEREKHDEPNGEYFFSIHNDATEIHLDVKYKCIPVKPNTRNTLVLFQCIDNPKSIVDETSLSSTLKLYVKGQQNDTGNYIQEISEVIGVPCDDIKKVLDCIGLEVKGQFTPFTLQPKDVDQTVGMDDPHTTYIKHKDLINAGDQE